MMAKAETSFGQSLAGLLEGIVGIAPAQEREIGSLTSDSRQVEPGALFLACAGGRYHGLAFARQVIEQGAVAILWEPDGAEGDRLAVQLQSLSIPLLPLPELSQRSSEIAARFYDDPSRYLKIYGITGTNGKTSISLLLAQALEDEAPCGIMGTLGYGFPLSLQSTGYTTPDAVTLQRLLAELKQQGAEAVSMEVSSHALDQGRAAAVHFDTAIFTNLSRDHFDYHGSFDNYAAAKQRLFQAPDLGSAVINLDDEMGVRLLRELAEGVEALVYSLDAERTIPAGLAGWAKASRITPGPDGMEIQLLTHQGEGLLKTRLLGRFNAANLLAVLLVLLQRGWDLSRVLRVMQGLSPIAGRMQLFGGEGKPSVVVDYAHTPDALEKALLAARVHCSGRLVVVFGCGGDRDRGKRPLMGSLAEKFADQVYVTDDNPRSEASAEIIAEILAGLREPAVARVVPDRGRAIRQAIQAASPGDLVLVAGKGHEDYQLVGDLTLHFDDREQVSEALTLWRGERPMNSLRLSQVAEQLEGCLMGADLSFSSVSTDSRHLKAQDLFIALQGPHFDGHGFIPQAIERGAAAVMVSQDCGESIPQIRVANTRQGLGRLAALWRDRFAVPLIAITGSNGKTTVKELIAAILRQRGPVLATEGNLNNDIGLPLTLLRLQEESCAVLEMGANHAGEIGYLSQIAHPDVAVITNAGAAHLEGFGDLRGVAMAKGEILSGLNPRGVAVLNADDDYFPLWRQLAGERRMISFGESSRARVNAPLSQVQTLWSASGFSSQMTVRVDEQDFTVELAMAGRHNLMNALAAIAAAWAMDCSVEQIQQGLASVQPVKGRLCSKVSSDGLRLIDDTYNANPDSVAAAIQVLRQAPGGQWLVLGDLAELGEGAAALHAQIGLQAKAAGLAHLYTLGGLSRYAAESFGEGGEAFSRIEDLLAALAQSAVAGDTLLIKGSRSAGMERVVQALLDTGRA